MLTEPRPHAGRGVDDDETAYEPPPSHTLLLVGALAVLALVVTTLVSWWSGEAGLFEETRDEGRVDVPDVVGRSETEAVGALESAGFDVTVQLVPNVEVEPGQVISQSPREGSLLEPGEPVQITTSLGSGFVPVPEVTGTIGDQVAGQLSTYGLVVGAISSRPDMTSLDGEILEQSPAPGEYVVMGTPVDLVVSEGPPPVRVPDVRGETESAATLTLTDLGFTVDSVRVYSSARRGTVVSTSPRADTEAEFGSQIRVFVSRGPAPVTTPPPTTPPPTDAPDPEPPAPQPPAPTTPTTRPGNGNGGGGGAGGGGGTGGATDG